MGCDDRRQGEHHRPGISIHAPQWGATCPSSSLLVLVIVFQSTHPSGVRRAPITKVRQARYFNPRTPVGCDLPTAPPLFDANNFNPRTPVGCDRRPAIAGDPQRPISIHAPQWGATRTGTTITNGFTHFNPRTPVGCDLSTEPNRSASPVISIHAPQWGATAHRPTGVRTHSDFNPRTPVGCDGIAPDKRLEAVIFQSTHPSGVRHAPFENPLAIFKFQSTHPSGVRLGGRRVTLQGGKFQSTHPSGVRPAHTGVFSGWSLFQSTHPSGVRRGRRWNRGRGWQISIHAPQWGATSPRWP